MSLMMRPPIARTNAVIFCGTPSSKTWNSSSRRSGTNLPVLVGDPDFGGDEVSRRPENRRLLRRLGASGPETIAVASTVGVAIRAIHVRVLGPHGRLLPHPLCQTPRPAAGSPASGSLPSAGPAGTAVAVGLVVRRLAAPPAAPPPATPRRQFGRDGAPLRFRRAGAARTAPSSGQSSGLRRRARSVSRSRSSGVRARRATRCCSSR